MPHHTPLIGTIVAGLVLAFLFGALAHRLRLSPLIGYLVAGFCVGPFTPGYVAHQGIANELAEIGVILLMFGVGLHFSLKDLLSVRRVAVPGAIGQMTVATVLGVGLAGLLGWPLLGGLVFGLALSVASTVVLLRALQDRRLVETERGRIAVGWLIVEDLAMVLALVLLPALAEAQAAGGAADIATALGLTVAKVGGFVAFMLIVGRRLIPWALHHVAHSGSRELFRLAVLATALGVAFGAAMLFGVSFALGAFFAGMVLAESPLSQRAAQETLPLRDAFAVLFFVSVGMLFNPAVIGSHPAAFLATVGVVVIGKSIAAYLIVRAFGRSHKTALTIAASLAQIGEFSFILATLGGELEVLPALGRDLILAAAILSILLNPLVFHLVDRSTRREPEEGLPDDAPPAPAPPDGGERMGHVIIVGYGRVGSLVGHSLGEQGGGHVVIETEHERRDSAMLDQGRVVIGNAVSSEVLRRAGIADARALYVAIPDAFEAGQIVEQARALNARLRIVARAHSDDEVEHLERLGATRAIMGEREIARRMVEDAAGG